MSKKLIFTGVVVGIGGFIGGYLFGKKYKAKTYGEAFNDGRDWVRRDLQRVINYKNADNEELKHYFECNYHIDL